MCLFESVHILDTRSCGWQGWKTNGETGRRSDNKGQKKIQCCYGIAPSCTSTMVFGMYSQARRTMSVQTPRTTHVSQVVDTPPGLHLKIHTALAGRTAKSTANAADAIRLVVTTLRRISDEHEYGKYCARNDKDHLTDGLWNMFAETEYKNLFNAIISAYHSCSSPQLLHKWCSGNIFQYFYTVDGMLVPHKTLSIDDVKKLTKLIGKVAYKIDNPYYVHAW